MQEMILPVFAFLLTIAYLAQCYYVGKLRRQDELQLSQIEILQDLNLAYIKRYENDQEIISEYRSLRKTSSELINLQESELKLLKGFNKTLKNETAILRKKLKN